MRIAEIAEAADDRFFFGGLLTARSRDGVETQLHFRTVNWVASGKVRRRRVFRERAETLQAAGLRERASCAPRRARGGYGRPSLGRVSCRTLA